MASFDELIDSPEFKALPPGAQLEVMRQSIQNKAIADIDRRPGQAKKLPLQYPNPDWEKNKRSPLNIFEIGYTPEELSTKHRKQSSTLKRELSDPLSMMFPALQGGASTVAGVVPNLISATTPGEAAGVGVGSVLGGATGALAQKAPVPLLRTLGAMIGGFAGNEAQAATPMFFGEDYKAPSDLSRVMSAAVPGVVQRTINRPAQQSAVAKSRQVMDLLGVPSRNLQAAKEQTPELTTRPVFDRFREAGKVPETSPEIEQLDQLASQIKGTNMPIPTPKNTNFPVNIPAVEAQQAKLNIARVKAAQALSKFKVQAKDLAGEQKQGVKADITKLKQEDLDFRQGQREEAGGKQIEDLQLTRAIEKERNREAREAMKDERLGARIGRVQANIPMPPNQSEILSKQQELGNPQPTPKQQVLNARISDRSGKLDVNAVDQATLSLYKTNMENEVARIADLRKQAVARLEKAPFAYGGHTPTEIDDLKKLLAGSEDSEVFTKKVFSMPSEQWEAFQKFISPQEKQVLRDALGQLFVRESSRNVGPEFRGSLMNAPRTLEQLTPEKIGRFYNPKEVNTLEQFVKDIGKIRVETEDMKGQEPRLRMYMGNKGSMGFAITGTKKLLTLDFTQNVLDRLFSDPNFGPEIHKLANNATVGTLMALPAIRQWINASNVIKDKEESAKTKP